MHNPYDTLGASKAQGLDMHVVSKVATLNVHLKNVAAARAHAARENMKLNIAKISRQGVVE
jgi:hypothetical protein